VDDRELYLGSQNLDWRSLEHIQELGVRVRDRGLVADLRQLFELDWRLAGGAGGPAVAPEGSRAPPLRFARLPYGDGVVDVALAGSPEALVPHPSRWDLPHLLGLVAGARERVRLQFLSYSTVSYGGTRWDGLDRALRAAASRGVQVELLVSDWSLKPKDLGALQALAAVEGVTVRFVRIPQWSGGSSEGARRGRRSGAWASPSRAPAPDGVQAGRGGSGPSRPHRRP